MLFKEMKLQGSVVCWGAGKTRTAASASPIPIAELRIAALVIKETEWLYMPLLFSPRSESGELMPLLMQRDRWYISTGFPPLAELI